ncbi:MAG: penicillin-binding protein, partial [Saprospiraceae bacterium]|nr:penicillin-binding protein [Saprospiraceae bacterium]
AVRLERKYTKEEIIAMYLNKFDFLNDGDGIKAAAEIYFGKSQDSLDIQEAATLVGMLKNPSLFNPVRYPDTVLHRRMVVLKQMQNNGVFSEEVYDSLRQVPLGLSFRRKTHNDGLAPYFRGALSQKIGDILDREDVRKADGSRYDLYRDGLRIYTTIDPEIQRQMELAAAEHMAHLQQVFDRYWSSRSKDPWKYKDRDTSEGEMQARKRKLARMVRESERFESLRATYLDPTIELIRKEVGDVRFLDADIDRMLAQEEDPSTFKRMLSDGTINENLESDYSDIMNSAYWPQLKEKWEELQEVAKEVFNTPVEMRVFTYENDEMEKDTVMSPLDSLIYHHHFLQIGSLAVDPITGFVKGWVGGINYKYFKFDHIQSRRQVGSTFKPFVYATAIAQQGISPCFRVWDFPQSILPGDGNFHLAEEWTPSNSDGKYTGEALTLKEGLAKSKNTVSVYLMKQLRDTEPVRDLIDNMGISKEAKYANGRYIVPKAPSICLGATDLSVMEMTGAYTTFANNGIYNKPRFITKIEDRNGRLLYEEEPEERQAIEERPNYVMVEMLRYASGGMGLESQVGGKTGTTNDYVDGWFMGITPSLVVGTWVGGEDRWIRFLDLLYGQGAYMAKPYFKKVMQRLEKDEEADYDKTARFHIPPGDLGIEMDCSKYEHGLPSEGGDTFNEYDGFAEDVFGDEELLPRRDSSFQRDRFEEQ